MINGGLELKDCAIQRTNTSGYNTAQAKEGVGLGKPDKLIVLGNGFTIDFFTTLCCGNRS